jgi:hypothetical protein
MRLHQHIYGQTLGFQSRHYRRVDGVAALATGEDVDTVDRLSAAGSDVGGVGLNRPRLPVPAYCHDAQGKTSPRIRDGDWQPSSIRWARNRIADKGAVAV